MIKRVSLKQKQRDIAKKLKTHPVYLNAVLRGRARPSPDLAKRISKLTGIPVMFLLYREIKKKGR
jgi:transcriptional regulator with XRE-family HTH domain